MFDPTLLIFHLALLCFLQSAYFGHVCLMFMLPLQYAIGLDIHVVEPLFHESQAMLEVFHILAAAGQETVQHCHHCQQHEAQGHQDADFL